MSSQEVRFVLRNPLSIAPPIAPILFGLHICPTYLGATAAGIVAFNELTASAERAAAI